MKQILAFLALYSISGCELMNVSFEAIQAMENIEPGPSGYSRNSGRPKQTDAERERNAIARAEMERTVGPDRIKAVQQLLNGLGYDCGEPTGVVDGQTRDAIIDYEFDHGLEITGWVSDSLITHLAAQGSRNSSMALVKSGGPRSDAGDCYLVYPGTRVRKSNFEVAPGPTIVEMSCSGGIFDRRQSVSTFDFVAEAGHTYTFAATDKNCLSLLDITSEEKLIACEPYQ